MANKQDKNWGFPRFFFALLEAASRLLKAKRKFPNKSAIRLEKTDYLGYNRENMQIGATMSTNRLAWDEYFAAQALLIANRSTCKRAKVGAVLVKDNKVISTGYNGSVSGTEHCIDHDCLVIDGHCVRTLHAEVNAILQGAERGVPKGFTAYVTHFPCLNCTKQLLQVGCKRVVYINQYRIDDYAQYLYREKEVELVHLPLDDVKKAIAQTDLV
ncbi:dCMP deaminase / Late competence protein ComEB [Streptococcus sp. DD11]|nr:dCMP deaminase / Late competence protein ComEB [Streptococcus sp. DD11]